MLSDADPERDRREFEERERERDRQWAEVAAANIRRDALQAAADSATVEMAELLIALVDLGDRQASQLQALAEDSAQASRTEEQRHRSVMRWTRAGVGLAAVAAAASVVVLVL